MEFEKREVIGGRRRGLSGTEATRLTRILDDYLPIERDGVRLYDKGVDGGRFGLFGRSGSERGGGFHAMLTFVDHSEIPPMPHSTPDEISRRSSRVAGVLRRLGDPLHRGIILDDDSGGIAYQHAFRITSYEGR